MSSNHQCKSVIQTKKTKTTDEAIKLLKSDPAIKEGLLDYDLYNWYGSAALPEYLEVADKIWKVKP